MGRILHSDLTTEFQSTHPMRGGTDGGGCADIQLIISIHPPHAGWDSSLQICKSGAVLFQSTHPMRGGTFTRLFEGFNHSISIHPPHAGWDPEDPTNHDRPQYFNPPTPCGVGRMQRDNAIRRINFNPPTPCGVGPYDTFALVKSLEFQSTHPMRGGTLSAPLRRSGCLNFNPPTPCGVGLRSPGNFGLRKNFNPPTPCGVGLILLSPPSNEGDFNPPTPCGVGLGILGGIIWIWIFQSTHPMRGGTGKIWDTI